jgi:hypothetical protein
MTAEVKFDEGQKQLMSEFELHCGIIGSQVLRQDGRRDGQGELGGGEPAGGAEDESGITGVESVPGGAKVDVLQAGGEFGGPERGGDWDVSVFGGAAVHLVHKVWVEVMIVVEIVDVVWVTVTDPDVDVKVTGHVVKVV